jgi:hypothetical protein
MATPLLSLKGKSLILKSQHVSLGCSPKSDVSWFSCLGDDFKATKSTEIIRDYVASLATIVKRWFQDLSPRLKPLKRSSSRNQNFSQAVRQQNFNAKVIPPDLGYPSLLVHRFFVG